MKTKLGSQTYGRIKCEQWGGGSKVSSLSCLSVSSHPAGATSVSTEAHLCLNRSSVKIQ